MNKKILGAIITLVLIFPTFSFLLGNKMFTFHDETQIANLHQYFKSIDLGQFPPRWAPDMHFQYGSPFLSYNYQLPYYLGYLGHLLGLPLTSIFKLLLVIAALLGAAGMYQLGLSLTSNPFYATFTALLYSYTPYQAVDRFVRGTLGEVFALAIFPWLILASLNLCRKVTLNRVLTLGISFSLLIISHQPAALFGLPLFSFIFLFYALISRQSVLLKAYLQALLISLLLSAYYWIPVIFEAKFIVATSPFNYLNQFPFLKQLIYSPWTYSGANPFSSDTFSFQIGIINLIILLIAVLILIIGLTQKAKTSLDTWLLRLLTLSTLAVIFLMNIRSNFIWTHIKIFQSVQFPWRLLMFTTLFTSILLPLLLKRLNSSLGRVVSVVGIVMVILLNISYFKPGKIVDYPDSYYLRRFLPTAVLLPGEKISATYLLHAEDYVPLPRLATRPTSLPSSKLTSPLLSTIIIISDPDPYYFKAIVRNKSTDQITFHSFAYPGWQVKSDGYDIVTSKNEIGAITFSLSAGNHEIIISYQDSPLRLISNIISLASFAFSVSYLIYQLVSNKGVTSTAGKPKPPRERH